MSFRVLVIPEDPTYNGYILKPLVVRMLAEIGKPKAQVTILSNPRIGGYEQAVRAIQNELSDRYGHFDLWLFLPDADVAGDLMTLEKQAASKGVLLFCCAAVPEVEAWLLAGHRNNLPVGWSSVRRNPRLKEGVFEPFLSKHGDLCSAGGGREALMRQTLSNYRGLLELCPELANLEQRLREALKGNTI